MKPLNIQNLRDTAQRRLTCAPLDCHCEADCFRLSEALLLLLPDPLSEEPDDPNVIADYAPDWSAS